MFTAGIISFRETLEAVLVVGIVLSFLAKTNQHSFKKFVWAGIAVGVLVAIALSIFIQFFFGGLSGKMEELFEGILMFVTAGFLTWMILWVHRQKEIVKKLKQKVAFHADRGYGLGISFLVATSVFREGTETALYVQASTALGASNQILGVGFGLILALVLGVAMFKMAMKIKINTIFNITSVFLLLFAAGLVSHGVHEFQEAGVLPIFSFDPIINVAHVLDHKSLLGSFLRILFGYTSQPTILELISYGSYILLIYWLKRFTDSLLVSRFRSS